MKIYRDTFEKIVSLENLFSAWDEFKKDKHKKRDVQQFEWRLEENIFQLHRDLQSRQYRHGSYAPFYIRDPKQRLIHKATVRDRIVHHAVFSVLSPIFEPTFIAHSFSCRIDKGTHKGVETLERWLRQISGNGTRPCFVLKCDIRRFFATVDHEILLRMLRQRIRDDATLWLLREIVESFSSEHSTPFQQKGLPIGNLTSQLFANIYLNEFDQFVKHKLKVRWYGRYTDDFVIASADEAYLRNILPPITDFLAKELELKLHPEKLTVRKFSQGIDFLGYILLPHHRVLRTKTKRRIFKKLKLRVEDTGTASSKNRRWNNPCSLTSASSRMRIRIDNAKNFLITFGFG